MAESVQYVTYPLSMHPADSNQVPNAVSATQLDDASQGVGHQLSGATDESTLVIPVLEEQIQVTKHRIETGQVRLIKTVEATDETIATPLNQEEFVIERVPIDQYVEVAPATRQEGETTIYPVLREVLVVEKRLLLVEEVHVTKRLTQRTDEQTVTLRRESIRVERDPLTDERSA